MNPSQKENMHPWEKRFEGIAQEKKLQMLKELDDQIAPKGEPLLTAEEKQELLTLVSPRFFKLIQGYKMDRIKKRAAEFPEIVGGAKFEQGIAGMTDQGKKSLSSLDEDEVEEFVMQMDRLQFLHPSLWFKVYKNLAAIKLSWAVELESQEKEKKFLPT